MKQLVEPFHTMNLVMYMDNVYVYTFGPLIVDLRKHDIFVVSKTAAVSPQIYKRVWYLIKVNM